MHQRKYALQLISETGLGTTKPAMSPIDTNAKLTSKEYDDHLPKCNGQTEAMADQSCYQRLIGKLLYLTMTRPDISFCAQTLSQYLQAPKQSHMKVVLKIVRFLKRQLGQGVLLASNNNFEMSAYVDAVQVACPNTRRSVTSYVVNLGESLINWKSKKQTTVLKISVEAKYRSIVSVVAELVQIVGLTKKLCIDIALPISVYNDSKATMQIEANPVYRERTKHIEIDCYFIWEKINQGMVSTKYIATKDQPVDIFTKALSRSQHEQLSYKLGILNIFEVLGLRGSVKQLTEHL